MSRKTVIGRLSKKYINTSDDSDKFTSVETDMGDYDIDTEIDADIVITDDVKPQKATTPKVETEPEDEMVIDDLSGEATKEISYAEFKNNPDTYRAVPNSYNSSKKTIKVYC